MILIHTDTNSEFMDSSTGISTDIQTKIRRALLAANAMVATMVKLAFVFGKYIQLYTHLCTCMECICMHSISHLCTSHLHVNNFIA